MHSHGKLLGALILVGGFFVAFGVSEVVGSWLPKYDRALGFSAGGLAMAVVDLAIRRVWGEGSAAERYATPGYGPHVSLAACWMVGLLFILLGVWFAFQGFRG